MSCILHIETSTSACSVAVSEDGQNVFKKEDLNGPSHAVSLGKCEFRRDIASSDDFTELFYNIVRSFALDHIQIKVCILTGDL